MPRLIAIMLSFAGLTLQADDKPRPKDAPPPGKPATMVVESTLPTASPNIRQFAFDGKTDTYYASDKPATAKDHFTLILDKPVTLQSVRVITGRPMGEEKLLKGVLEISADGKAFTELAQFEAGDASGKAKASVKAVRIRPTADQEQPLVIREITLESEPKVACFTRPIEFFVDVKDAPEMQEWADQVARICERQYPMIVDELDSEGFKPLTTIRMRLKNDYKGVAEASGGNITGSVKYFKTNPVDVGAMVHETVHCVQLYRSRRNPGWLVEGVADYLRFFRYEENKPRPLSPERAKYDGSYRTTAAFLAFVSEKYDSQIVRKMNASMRSGNYNENLWKECTGKTVEELARDWKNALSK